MITKMIPFITEIAFLEVVLVSEALIDPALVPGRLAQAMRSVLTGT